MVVRCSLVHVPQVSLVSLQSFAKWPQCWHLRQGMGSLLSFRRRRHSRLTYRLWSMILLAASGLVIEKRACATRWHLSLLDGSLIQHILLMVPSGKSLPISMLQAVSGELMSVDIGRKDTTTLYCLSFRRILPPSFSVNSTLWIGCFTHLAASALVSSRTIPWLHSLKSERSCRLGAASIFNKSNACWKTLASFSVVVSFLMSR